ncbi:MAG: hypothetical protein JWO45_1059 [Spartobacteria bacterium]|nr:hypothetical protein [Spartobacteria bacterium]
MKFVFGLTETTVGLLAFLCIALFSLGISGGPDYGGGATVTITGSYSGVFSPQPCTTATPKPNATPLAGRCEANSIGVFNILVPKSGAATGPVIIFNEGEAYSGTVQGSADSVTAKITGLIHGTFNFVSQVVTGTEETTDKDGNVTVKTTFATQTFAAQAVGQMTAKARSIVSGTSSLVRLKGKADVQFSLAVNSIFDEIAYVVTGSKQSEAQ